jgi:predicted ATPase/class 3 adenylate cyclase
MTCSACGFENRAGRRFCAECGAPLSVFCPHCGAANESWERFCGDCGAPLAEGATAQALVASPPAAAPAAERRLVTVLFGDLVGFTAASEQRDAEETRELLSRYFELARTLIARYGGTVEKFIGDAVMAVWGTPVATEDDAERAVRAALDLVGAVPELAPGLQMRAGVLTGEAAVTLGASGEGMVAGDLVNTASRIQTAAAASAVLAGEATRRATEQAIVYDDAGAHTLKGKAEPVQLWRAVRVVSGVGGQLRSEGLEAPFVGRERELKLIKELFHAASHDGRAHLVSVTGIAGIGKSRLVWEFYKYFDGIVDRVWWHRGRCLAYGEGVAYWALADMVRMRCRIAEDEEPASAREKLRATLAEHVLDESDRRFVEPRLAQLIGLEEGAGGDRQDLFAAWRLFFERLAGTSPVVLAFEDMQWADAALLDFVEYLLEWSRDFPLYVITLARPELLERRPSWGAGQRSFTSLYLEPLPEPAMRALLEGLVPGLPDVLQARILARAEGVPLYAVETVRMLLDRGLLVAEGSAYRVAGAVETLEVPETLQALIAARLDGLTADERRLLQDGAVLGKTVTLHALAALTGQPEEELEPRLRGLVRKEVLGVQADPRSPDHGQYGFLQDLVRRVAYETLARRERKTRHLAAAAHLESAFTDLDEVAEVIASHYLAAYEAAPDADDADAIRAGAGEMLTRAGERAAALGAPEEARRYYEQAADLAEEPLVQAELLEHAGRLAFQADRLGEARERLERAIALFADAGESGRMGRATAALAEVELEEGLLAEGAARLEQAIEELEQARAERELAEALAQLGRIHVRAGRLEAAAEPLERALTFAEHLQLPAVFVEALLSKAIALSNLGRLNEARILTEAAAARAYAEELYASALRAENNLASMYEMSDRLADASEAVERALALAHRRGDRRWEDDLRSSVLAQLFLFGRWDEALAVAAEEEPHAAQGLTRVGILESALVLWERGEVETARALLDRHADLRDSADLQVRAALAGDDARALRAERRFSEALAAAERALALREDLGISHPFVKRGLVEAIEAALALGEPHRAEELLGIPEGLKPGELTPYLQGHAARLRARVDAAAGEHERVEEEFAAAATVFREFDFVFYLAVTQLELAEWLAAQGRGQEAADAAAEAQETFARLRATPWLERASRLVAQSEDALAAEPQAT